MAQHCCVCRHHHQLLLLCHPQEAAKTLHHCGDLQRHHERRPTRQQRRVARAHRRFVVQCQRGAIRSSHGQILSDRPQAEWQKTNESQTRVNFLVNCLHWLQHCGRHPFQGFGCRLSRQEAPYPRATRVGPPSTAREQGPVLLAPSSSPRERHASTAGHSHVSVHRSQFSTDTEVQPCRIVTSTYKLAVAHYNSIRMYR